MEKTEYIQHWNYFCSLASKLEETKDYVYHGSESDADGNSYLIHGNVYSDVFKQIILLASSEFELMAKVLCEEKGKRLKKKANIVQISKTILNEFPRITETEIDSSLWASTPLEKWSVSKEDKDEKVNGLDWWNAYTSLKHNEVNSYRKATLENAVSAVSALYIINLYVLYVVSGNLSVATEYPNAYFRCKYTASAVILGEGLLPDFGNLSAYEVAKQRYPLIIK